MAASGEPQHRRCVKSSFIASLSPPLWKDQIKQRCMQRLKQNRRHLVAKLRNADGNLADEMRELVRSEHWSASYPKERTLGKGKRQLYTAFEMEGRAHGSLTSGIEENAYTVEELMDAGMLSQADYLEIVHSLEDALREELHEDEMEDELRAQEMIEYEEASLAAMLDGMELNTYNHPVAPAPVEQTPVSKVKCPICRTGVLREVHSTSPATVVCECGLSLHSKDCLHGALEDLQDRICASFLDHCELCRAEPRFVKGSRKNQQGEMEDTIILSCSACGFHGCI